MASASFLAILLAASPAALAQAAPICLKSSSGMANCAYQTVAQCEAAKGMNLTAQCIPNSQLSTVGSGSGMSPGGITGQGGLSPRPSPSPTR
jgi:hypothetical protein